ncbi:MKRN2 opposite strand protein [Daktulosphaira vitifoliae]|uniref:MKRN2 opposite strand protein n=1 Tax=Daktulosphaira vitifoliae TaxID=58002 RepID=UPI0021A9B23A|nr:MKRN2 opposite strand protein [Daktulosphaira vitifoliae]
MNNDPGIECYRHCIDKNIFCFNTPVNCHVCTRSLSNSACIPVRVPYPFVRGSQQPCSIIIKTTEGDFLNTYQLMDDLHIGITTSKCVIVSFDWNGITKDVNLNNWNECLVILQLKEINWEPLWDNVLSDIIKSERWNSIRYNEETHNCFSFVMDFMKQFNFLKTFIHSIKTREEFTEMYVAPSIIKAQKYINLYRKIVENGFYIYNQVSNEILCT